MSAKPRALARRVAQVLTTAVVVAGGVAVVASPASAAVPTISTVFVAGSATNKVVTSGTTVVITGVGFTGMVDNATGATGIVGGTAAGNDAPCNVMTAIPLGCSQVRFTGAETANTAANFTAATAYVVVSDTVIYATVPAGIPVNTGTLAASPGLYTGKMLVQVVNTAVTGMGLSASAASDVYYRHPLIATVTTPPPANPLGGGTVAVEVTTAGAVAYTFSSATTSPIVAPATNFSAEKITAYLVSSTAGAPAVNSATVTYTGTASTLNVAVPAGTPATATVGVMLVHDGILGTADSTAVTYPAVITSMSTCGATAPATFATAVVTCTGPASASAATSGTYYVKVTGKGLLLASAWDFGANESTTCVIISDTVANCTVIVSGAPSPVVAVSFTPGDPPGAAVAPTTVGTTAGSIFVFTDLV